MLKHLFTEFLAGEDTLRVYEGDRPVFSSKKEGLMPLMEYLSGASASHQGVMIFDKVMGNAAALLSVKVGCREVWSPLGSELAIRTLERYGVSHHLSEIVPYITQADGKTMCPMEKLSIDKEPEEFYRVLKTRIEASAPADSC